MSTTGSKDNTTSPLSNLYSSNNNVTNKDLPPIDQKIKLDIITTSKAVPNNPIPSPGRAAYFNSPSFTEKAREFLQFGKILPNRSSSNNISGSSLHNPNRFINVDRLSPNTIPVSSSVSNNVVDVLESKSDSIDSVNTCDENNCLPSTKDVSSSSGNINYSLSKSGSPPTMPILDCIYESSDEEMERIDDNNNQPFSKQHRKQHSNGSAVDSVKSAMTSSLKSFGSFSDINDLINNDNNNVDEVEKIFFDNINMHILSDKSINSIAIPRPTYPNSENNTHSQFNVFSEDSSVYSLAHKSTDKLLVEDTISNTLKNEDNMFIRKKANKIKNTNSILDDIISRSRTINIPRHPSTSSIASSGDRSVNSGPRINLKINPVKHVPLGGNKLLFDIVNIYNFKNQIQSLRYHHLEDMQLRIILLFQK